MEFSEESIADRIAANYPPQYRYEVEKRLTILSTYKNVPEKDVRLLIKACNQLGLDDLQTKFAMLCARTRPKKTEVEVYPQIYAYFANIANPNEKDPFKVTEENDLQKILSENFNKHSVDVLRRINLALDASPDLQVLYGIYQAVKHKIPYAGKLQLSSLV